MHATDELGPSFSEWQALTDAYAEGVDALMRQEPGAAGTLARLATQLRRYAQLFGGDDEAQAAHADAEAGSEVGEAIAPSFEMSLVNAHRP